MEQREAKPSAQSSNPDDVTTVKGRDGAVLPSESTRGLVDELEHARVFEPLFRQAAEPTTLGRYVVLDTLGQGGMGVVLRAFDRELDRPVALKVLHEGFGEQNTARLRREAQAMAKLSHPNVVQVYEVGQVEDRTFVAMELVKGQTLKEWMQQEPRPDWRACAKLFASLGEGLAAAHERGLVHRDFKPANAIIDTKGRPRVLDFGLALHDEHGDIERESIASHRQRSGPHSALQLDASLTTTGMVLGTPAYMPPEQMTGDETDARSDQFSFCVSLYEALYGERPFEGGTMLSLMVSMRERKVRPIPKGTKVPAALRKIVLRGLAPAPDERWPSMEAFVAELRRLVAPRGRWWAVAGVTVGLTAIGGGMAYGEYLEFTERCTGAQTQLQSVWDDTRRLQVRDAILGTDLVYAPSTWERVEQRLESYAVAWSTKHTEVCEATSVRGEQSEEHMGLRMGCLRDRRRHLRATVDELSRADATVVENAVDLVASLPRLERCDDLDVLTATVPPPEDPEVTTEVEALRDRLASIAAQQEAGRYVSAEQEVEPVVEQALALAYEPLIAETKARRGVLHGQNGHYEDAEQDLHDAYALAMKHRHYEVALHTVQHLALVAGRMQDRAIEGRLWSRVAIAHAERSGDELEFAQSLSTQGNVLVKHGQYGDAQRAHERAREIRTRVLGTEHPTVAASLTSLSLVFVSRGKYTEAQQHSERALEILETALGADHPRVATTLSGLANALQLQGQYELAQGQYERVLEIKRETLGAEHISMATTLSNLARAHWGQGSYDRAQLYYEQVLELQQKVLGGEHSAVATTLSNVGFMLEVQGHHEQAQQRYERAIELQEAALGPDHPDVARTLVMLGGVHKQRERFERARIHYERALEIQEQVLGSDHPTVASTLRDLADVIDRLGEDETARQYYERAQQILDRAPGVDPRFVAYNLTNLANLLITQGEHEPARQHLERALRILEDALGADHLDMSIPLNVLGLSLLSQGEYEQARRHHERALQIVEKALGADHPDMAYSLINLAEVALASGEYDTARDYAERIIDLSERADVRPSSTIQARFVLARVLWNDPSKRTKARAMVERARDELAAIGVDANDELAEVQNWLDEHRAR